MTMLKVGPITYLTYYLQSEAEQVTWEADGAVSSVTLLVTCTINSQTR